MVIRFTDKPSEEPRCKPASEPARDEAEAAQAAGEARFATPIEAVTPVNPDVAGELPFADLPAAEKAEPRKREPKAAPRK